MTCEEIVSRAAYDIGDEFYTQISKDEWLRMLRRVYRDFCEETKILRNVIKFTTSTNKSYKLSGIDGSGNAFGENFLGIFRAEYNNLKAYEVDLDTIKLTTYPDSDATNHTVFYLIQYIQEFLWICFAHTPKAGDVMKIWYYELPAITDLTLASSPKIDGKYHDKLVLGLTVKGWDRLFVKAVAAKESPQILRIYKDESIRVANEFTYSKKKVEQEVMAYKDDTIPIVAMIATPFEDTGINDTNLETEENAF